MRFCGCSFWLGVAESFGLRWRGSFRHNPGHSGGVHVALFDGSVRFLSQNVDFLMTGGSNFTVADSVYEYLIHIKDGQVIGEY